MASDRPNIVLILTDQQRGDALGIEGHPVLQTPNLDWLAATGARFTRVRRVPELCAGAAHHDERHGAGGQRRGRHGPGP